MSHIILSDDQAKLLAQNGPVQVLDSRGNILGHIEPLGFTPEELAAARRRAATGAWYTGDEVRAHLHALDEAVASEGNMDRERVREVLKDIRENREK